MSDLEEIADATSPLQDDPDKPRSGTPFIYDINEPTQKILALAERAARREGNEEPYSFSETMELPNFLDGTLHVVTYYDDNDYQMEKYVHEKNGQFVPYGEATLLLAKVPEALSLARREAHKTLVASLIAGIITATICILSAIPYVLAFREGSGISLQDLKPPDILSNGLAAILGFYFATWSPKQ